jgi:hypothetical protein
MGANVVHRLEPAFKTFAPGRGYPRTPGRETSLERGSLSAVCIKRRRRFRREASLCIGENAPLIRERICNELGFLGIELDKKRNAKNAPLISADAGRVRVRVIRTNEEAMIARSVTRVLNLGAIRKT